MENKENKLGINWKNMFIIAGAYVSYMVGSGFASGNEAFQFFGSWGMPGIAFAIIGSMVVSAISCYSLYKIGQKKTFEKTSDLYRFLGGKNFTWFFQVFIFIDIFCSFMIMFSGAGSLLNQLFSLPQWVGAVLLGIVTGVVTLGGLKTVENVLGGCGILIQLYLIVFGIITLFHPAADFSQAAGAVEAVEAGIAYQANLFALPPLGWIPGLSSLNNSVIEGILYSGVLLICGVPFIMTLGKRTNNKKELETSSVLTTIAMYLCVIFVLVIILANFNSVINEEAGTMYPFPVISAIEAMWPEGAWTYSIIIFIGIFTTACGFLWVLCDWFLPNQEKTKKSNILLAVLILIGMSLGGVFPFSAVVNFLFPIFGLAGVIMAVVITIKAFKIKD